MHSQDKWSLGRIFKSSFNDVKNFANLPSCSEIHFSFFLPTHLPAIELVPGDLKKESETNMKNTGIS